jgi:hypothetical protein
MCGTESQLPADTIREVMTRLDFKEAAIVQPVCKMWRREAFDRQGQVLYQAQAKYKQASSRATQLPGEVDLKYHEGW